MAKVAVITGSNGLIGQATCRRLGQSGHLAVGIDVGAEGAGNWPHYQCDLRDLARMEATLAAIERDHGLIRVLFNNAGICHPGKGWLRRAARPVRRHDVSQRARAVLRFHRRW